MSREPVGGLRGEFARWEPDDAITAANRALERLRALGVKVTPGNRLERARDQIAQAERLHVQLGPGDWDMEFVLAEANKTIFEQHLIVSGLRDVDKLARKKLGIMLKGEPTPTDSSDDPPRDEQAEFFTAALLWAAGYRVDLGEPDLIITRGNSRLGVAVKRVKSDKQFYARVTSGEKQLKRQSMFGFIVVNADRHLNRIYQENRSADLSRTLFEKTAEWIDYVDLTHSSGRVLAVIGMATSFRRISGKPGRAFDVALHFHSQFVSDDTVDPTGQVHVVANRMAHALATQVQQLMQF
jgi:hypothetical protein